MKRWDLLCAAVIWGTLAAPAGAVTQIWDNGASTLNWSNPTNWSGNAVPVAGDDVVFDSSCMANCLADRVTNFLGSIKLDTGYTGTVSFAVNAVAGGMSLTVNNDIDVKAGNLVFSGNTTTLNGGTAGNPWGIGYDITAANVSISVAAAMNADGMGFPAGNGPGKSVNSYGSSHAGEAGNDDLAAVATGARPVTYGGLSGPTTLGSGANGAINSGGGAIKLTIGGTCTVNGRLSADGRYSGLSNNRGAAGGSLWIRGGTLNGSGTISASGSSGANCAGGGGGHIDIAETTNNFAGNIRSWGGTNGSGYWYSRGKTGTLRLPQADGTGWTVNSFVVTNMAMLGNDMNLSNVVVRPGASLYLDAQSNQWIHTMGSLTITGTAAATSSVVCLADYLDINTNSGGVATNRHGRGVTLVAKVVTIGPWTQLESNGQGYNWKNGTGAGGATDNGASHGGRGLRFSGTGFCYGAVSGPTALGSGGGAWYGGYGGGAIKLLAGTITNQGAILANGIKADNNHSAGSGGSLWIECAELAGTGAVQALGGNSGNNRPGGGGRITVVLTNANPNFEVVSNRFSAAGGTYSALNWAGAAGTVFLRLGSAPAGKGMVWVNNGNGVNVSNTVWTEWPPRIRAPGESTAGFTLITTNRAEVLLTTNAPVADLFVTTNSLLRLAGNILTVNTRIHPDWGGANRVVFDGGQILWKTSGGTLLFFR